MDQPKVYHAAARLDATSDSYDSDSPLRTVDVKSIPHATHVTAALQSFEGVIAQAPPAISAVKIGGVPAYKLARSGRAAPLKPRNVHIYWVQLEHYRWPELTFAMCCGRGTYVRSVIRDLGHRLGTGGCLTSLVRRRVGPFAQSDAWTFESLETAAGPDAYMIDVARARTMLAPDATSVPDRP